MTRIHLHNVSPKAVILGATTDIVATNIAMVPVVAIILLRLGAGSSAQQGAALTTALSNSATLYLLGMALGCAASILGGWVAARIARRAELLNGALSAVACMGLGVYGMITHPASAPLWQHIAFLVLSPSLGALGGAIRKRQHERIASSPPSAAPTLTTQAGLPFTGIPRVIYSANRIRILIGVATLGFLFFGLVGLYGYAHHQSAIIVASVFFCLVGLVTIALLFLGGRLLRAGRRSHWLAHASALLATAIPVGLVILAVTSRHRAG